MKKEQLKPILKDFIHYMMDSWFEGLPLWKALGYSFVEANINKYDAVLEMFSNEEGDIDVDGIIKKVSETMVSHYQIDLQQFSPLLPNRILLITKEDINSLAERLGCL